MVNQGEGCLEDYIIQVFEEQEDQFYFPVTTQKEARSFIKALHIKGIQYDSLCEEIGEFEHNFSAWRKGLGRAGIGNRVIELINKPFQQLLLSDSEESGDEGEPNGNSVNISRLQNVVDKAHTNGDSVVRPRVEERLPLHQDRGVMEETQGEITQSWLNSIEKKVAAIDVETRPEIKVTNQGEALRNSREASQEPSREVKSAMEAKDEGVTLETVKLRKVEKKVEEPKVLMREKKEGNFERTLSFREKLQKARERESKTLSGGFTKDSPPSTPELNGKENISSSASPVSVKLEGDIGNGSCEKSKDVTDHTDDITKEEDEKEDVVEVRHEELEVTKGAEEDLLSQEVDKSDTSGSESEEEKEEEAEQKNEEEVASEVSTETSSITEDSPVNESYDSDLDQDSQDSTTEIGNLLRQLATLKEQSPDGPGFIYVFSDQSTPDDNVHRVKIGASRFPNKRLEQAKSFNTEIKLASAMPVSPRREALADVHQRLSSHQINGNTGWYRASLDQVLELVTMVAEKFPSESTEC